MGETGTDREGGGTSLGDRLSVPAPEVDAGELIDSGTWTVYQKSLTALAAIAIVFDGFDVQLLGFAIPALMKDWALPRSSFAPVAALGLAGMAVGGPLAGYIGDRWGRRLALIGTVALFGLATITTAAVDSIGSLAALRFLTGMGAGGAVPNAGALAAEFAPLRRRPAAVKLTIVCIPLGGMLGGLIAAYMLPLWGWRALYVVGGVLPLAFAAVLWVFLPESPRFLANHPSRWTELTGFLRRLGHRVEADCRFRREVLPSSGRGAIGTLLAPEFARDTIGLWIAFFFSLSGVFLVFGWLPALLTSQGLNVAAASTGLAAYNFGGVAGVLLWAILTTISGSRKPMLLGAAGAAASAILILAAPVDAVVLIAAIGLHGALANAIQTSMYALAAHVYPTPVRAVGVACSATLGRTGAILSSLFGAVTVGMGPAFFWTSIALGLLLAFCGLATVRRHIPARGK